MTRATYTPENIKAALAQVLGDAKGYKLRFANKSDVALSARISDREVTFTFNVKRIRSTSKLDELLEVCRKDLNL